jgi:hypothetical protein
MFFPLVFIRQNRRFPKMDAGRFGGSSTGLEATCSERHAGQEW